MSVEFVREGRRDHRCGLPPVRDLWWAKVRCIGCGSYWVSYGDEWLPEGLVGAADRWLRALWRIVRRRGAAL